MLRVKSYYEYTTKSGDTWDLIAFNEMGDEMFMSDLIAYNPDYTDTLIFDDGVTLMIPQLDEDDDTDSSTLPPWRSSELGSGDSASDGSHEPYDYELGDPDDEEGDAL